MQVQNFADIEPEFIERVHRMVWCSLATVGPDNRPRSRVLHTMWQGNIGWLLTRRQTFKTQHLAHNPYVSLAYIADILKPVYAECRAEWVDDPGEKQRRWDWFKNTPPPLGYDPAIL
jgi:general stress protein 26